MRLVRALSQPLWMCAHASPSRTPRVCLICLRLRRALISAGKACATGAPRRANFCWEREQNTLSHLHQANTSLDQPKLTSQGRIAAQMMSRRLATLLCTATALVPPAPHTRRLEPLSATLTVYSTLGCPHCQRCKKALDAAGLAYDVVDVADAAARAALEARCGLPTVPQV